MDLGIYCIYPMVTLFGKPEDIQASAIMLSSGVDGEGSLMARYPDMDGVIMYSKIADSYLPTEIQGENGTIVIDRINQPYEVKIMYRDGTTEELTRSQPQESMYYEALEFIELIQEGCFESAMNTHARSLAVAELMEEARHQFGLRYASDEV